MLNNEVVNKEPATQRESFSDLLGQIANNSSAMVHDEIALVIQGIREKSRSVRSGVLTVATGAIFGFGALMSLCAALIIGLTSYMAPVIAAFVTGAALAVISIVISFIGCRNLKKPSIKT